MKRIFFSLGLFLAIGFFAMGTVPVSMAQGVKVTEQPGMKVTEKDPAPATGFDLNIRLKNPLKVDTIPNAITLFINLVLKIALPFVIVFFIWSGLKFILAQGNKDKLKDAKNMFFGTVIGTLLILGAWTITNAIIGTVNSLVTGTTTK